MTTSSLPRPSLRGAASSRRAVLVDRIATGLLWAAGAFVLVILGAIILHFAITSAGVISPSFIFGNPSSTSLGGVGPLLWNSVYMLVLTMLISVPLGILAGIYMSEYASEGRVTNAIRFAEEAISSVPSIVVGLFGLIAFVDVAHWGFTALGGALALTIFNLPLMSRLAEQALRAVPADERAGSLALGATKWQTIRHVVVPLAIPGIVTGVILTAGRVFGEAAALLFTAGLSTPTGYNFANLNIADPRSPWSPFRPATTLSVYIWNINSEGIGQYVKQIADGASAILLAMVLIFNLGARLFGRILTRRLTAA
ncbi:MAG TPA: phosphate ABC transporter permease PstA [Candidatus Acidoferrales bacterium]|nr:phosphate ABC transporter permease PstA [Candidatus Acidoferrales bacterium]